MHTQGSLTNIATIFKFGDVAKKWPKINCKLGRVGGYPPHIYDHIFWQYVGQYVGPIFSWDKINEYFWYHPEIFLGVFDDNLC